MDCGTLAAVAAIVFGAIGLQGFWITRELDDIKARLARVEAALDRIEHSVLAALDRRVTRLEERLGGSGFS
jgi:hypothetical protein